MKYVFAAVLCALLGGCATDEDDRKFFNGGWMHPEKSAEERLYQR
jgi:hypothetical protein